MAILPVAFSIGIVVIVMIAFYKAFFKRRNIKPAYTPFDEITGQSPTAFPENSMEIVLDERSGDGKGIG